MNGSDGGNGSGNGNGSGSGSGSGGDAGVVTRLWRKRAHRGVLDGVTELRLVAGDGVEDGVDRGRSRQVTVIAEEAWEEAVRQLGRPVDPSARRANVLVRGVSLEGTRGRVLAIGDCRIEIRGETRPCERMDEACPGLQEALRPHWRGGAYGRVVTGGAIVPGALVRFLD